VRGWVQRARWLWPSRSGREGIGDRGNRSHWAATEGDSGRAADPLRKSLACQQSQSPPLREPLKSRYAVSVSVIHPQVIVALLCLRRICERTPSVRDTPLLSLRPHGEWNSVQTLLQSDLCSPHLGFTSCSALRRPCRPRGALLSLLHGCIVADVERLLLPLTR
jgi:hypothetical protein